MIGAASTLGGVTRMTGIVFIILLNSLQCNSPAIGNTRDILNWNCAADLRIKISFFKQNFYLDTVDYDYIHQYSKICP